MSHSISRGKAACLTLAALLSLAPAAIGQAGTKKSCSTITTAALGECRNAAQGDLDAGIGICQNVSDKTQQKTCISDAKSAFKDAVDSCKAQRAARKDVCKSLGEAPYEPGFAPADFDTNFNTPPHLNPLFPVAIGDEWTYHSMIDPNTTEVDHVVIRDATKSIDGGSGAVTCVVAHDVVTDNDVLSEVTEDWFGQAKNGDVYYCGEQAKQYQSFTGDTPPEPELVGVEGSFKAGVNGALPGILMLATPTVGKLYRQEFSLGEAEDLGQVLSTTYKFGQSSDLDAHVPQALAEKLCSNSDCLVTRDFSPLEPDAIERKYYAPGIGDFLEIDLSTGTVTQLVSCVMHPADARCDTLPQPP
jgi:hypothetical protein